MSVTVYYDPDTVDDQPLNRWCWYCCTFGLVQRTITAHLLTDDGVSTRRVRWVQCRSCGKQFKATSEEQ